MVSIIAWTVVETFFIVQLFKVFNKKNHQEAIKAIESEAEGVSYTPSYTSDIPVYVILMASIYILLENIMRNISSFT